MQLSMHKNVQNDSIKGEIKEVLYAPLEDASNISFHFREHLKRHKKLKVYLPVELRVHLRVH